MGYSNEQPSPEAMYDRALALLTYHSKKHIEIDAIRDLVRQRTQPKQVMKDKFLITSRSAMAWAIQTQMFSYFSGAKRQVEIPRDAKTQKEDDRTTKNEKWLIGSSAILNKQSDFVENRALYYGLETGEMILTCAFNPILARQGRFPIEVTAPDPACCAYDRSSRGLTSFVSAELRTVEAVCDELHTLSQRGSKVALPAFFLDPNAKRQELVEDMRLFTTTHEYRWVDGELIYCRKHFAGRVPVDIAYFYPQPSDRPEEWGRGVNAPVKDVHEASQQLLDQFVTDAELGSRPTGILVHGNGKFEIVQLSPGETYEIDEGAPVNLARLEPVPLNMNHQLLHELAGMMMEQIDIAALPRTTFSGPGFQLSGFAMEKYFSGLDARVTKLKEYPEIALASHYGLRLQMVRRFATSEMAKAISPQDPDRYLKSFSVLGSAEIERRGELKRIQVWEPIEADDVNDEPVVNVTITPDIPAQHSMRVQQLQAALGAGLPYEYSVRNVFEAEDAGELMRQHNLDALIANDKKFAEFYWEYSKKQMFMRDRSMAKDYEAWEIAQGLVIDGETVNPQLGPGAVPQLPPPGMDPSMMAAPPPPPQQMMQAAPPPMMAAPPPPQPPPMDPALMAQLMQAQGGGAPPPGMMAPGGFGDENMPMDPALVAELIAMIEGQQQGAPPMLPPMM